MDHETVTKRDVLLSYDLALLPSAARFNIDLKTERVRSNLGLHKLFFDILDLVTIDLFVEAGAHEAAASRRAAVRFPDIRAVAFEANPIVYEEFESVNAGTRVEYLHLALADVSGPVTFNALADPTGAPEMNGESSLMKRTDPAYNSIEVTVDGVTLDEFFADHEFTDAALWVDVEGACRLVLNGAREVLSRTAVLMIEVEEENYWGEGHWLRDDVTSFLYDLGLRPVARDFEYLYQYNLVFIRQDLLDQANGIRRALTRFNAGRYDPIAKPAVPERAPEPPPQIVQQPTPEPVGRLLPVLAAEVRHGLAWRARRVVRHVRRGG